MSLEEIEWTESEGDTDDNLALENLDDESEDEQEFNLALGGAAPAGRSTRRAKDEELDPEVEEAYQGARGLYTQGDYDGALALLEEAIKHEAGSKLLFNLLASIHEERHDLEKALLARIHVAALDKRDKDTWIDVAERSIQLGHLGQAAWCFQQVCRLDRDNWLWLRTRADLHMQLNQQTAALSLLQRIRVKFFAQLDHATKTQILLSIAGILKELGRGDEATKIYMDIYLAATSAGAAETHAGGMHAGTGTHGEVDLDWQNLNILCELLTDQKQYARLITVVKTGARYINGRGAETYWQQFIAETDAEFDSRRMQLLVPRLSARDQERALESIQCDPAAFDMPIDIRIWLLQARLKLIPPHLLLQARSAAVLESLPAVQDALVHLSHLRACEPVDMYSDLFKKGALAFFEARLYAESRELYIALTDIEHESETEYLEMTVQVAKCEMELHNVGRAEQLYTYVLERDPENQEALVAMGEIYAATNRVEESRRALEELEAVRAAHARAAHAGEGVEAGFGDGIGAGAGAAIGIGSGIGVGIGSGIGVGIGSGGIGSGIGSGGIGSGSGARTGIGSDFNSASGNVFVESQRQRATNARPSRAERAELERIAQRRADAAFAGLARYQSGLDAGNAVARHEWLRHADELVDMFATHRKFFPADKQKDFFEGSSNSSMDQRIARLRLVQLDNNPDSDADESNDDADDESSVSSDEDSNIDSVLSGKPSRTRDMHADTADMHAARKQSSLTSQARESFVWRGQPLSMWFWVFMQASLVHAKAGDAYRAQQIVGTAQAANVFSFDARRGETMQFVALACACVSGRASVLGELLRHLHTIYQFNPVTYRLYVALLGGSRGREALEVFGLNNNQKFFLRQIKALDSLVHHKRPVPGMAKVLDPEHAPAREDPQLLMLYVYIMLLGPSYSPALTYLIRVRKILPNHPLVLLVYGIVQMHRVTQRTSLNRHLQLLEGLSFMQDYASHRGTRPEQLQEVSYNFGRFFHGVGLFSIAVRYYEQALALRSEVAASDDLSREAAYNLHLIYAESRNMALSADIVDEYLVC